MRPLLTLTLVALTQLVSTAADPKVGDIVFLKEWAAAKVGSSVVDASLILFPSRVGDVNGDWLWLGIAWVQKSDVMFGQEAMEYYTERLRRKPKASKAWTTRGCVWSAHGEFDRAIKDHSEAIRLDPKTAGAYRDRGNCLFHKGLLDAALKDYAQAIRLDPTDAGA